MINASYVLKAYSSILANTYDKLTEVGYQLKDGCPIPSFDEDLLIELCLDAQMIFSKEKNILLLNGDMIIVGDIHGSLHDLLRILHFIQENNSRALFLGDYVDRGNFSLECMTLLFAFKIMFPNRIYLLRGNHEFDSMCSEYGFRDEILNYHNPKKIKKEQIKPDLNRNIASFYFKANIDVMSNEMKDIQCEKYYANHKDADCYKYSEKLYNSFIRTFNYLPIGAIINESTFCIHGGLSPRLEYIEQIEININRPISSFNENFLLTDIIWSDPSNNTYTFGNNARGRGYVFNENAVNTFLQKNSLKRIIRAHQCVILGSASFFNGKCITVFSSSSYSSEMGNNSGLLKLFQKNDKIDFISFPPLKRLQKSDAVYYKVQDLKQKINSQICFSMRNSKLTSNFAVRMHNLHHRAVTHHSELNDSRRPNLMFITNSRKVNESKTIIPHSNSFNDIFSEIIPIVTINTNEI